MNLKQRTLFESAAGGLLSELGYQVEGLARTLSGGERFLWETDHRVRSLVRILSRLRRPHRRRIVLSFGWAMVRPFLRRPASKKS